MRDVAMGQRRPICDVRLSPSSDQIAGLWQASLRAVTGEIFARFRMALTWDKIIINQLTHGLLPWDPHRYRVTFGVLAPASGPIYRKARFDRSMRLHLARPMSARGPRYSMSAVALD